MDLVITLQHILLLVIKIPTVTLIQCIKRILNTKIKWDKDAMKQISMKYMPDIYIYKIVFFIIFWFDFVVYLKDQR